MCTNWMVHMRPDIYVKWWHPRNKTAPLESEIVWNQNINIESNANYDITKRFQWEASTSFSFKTWVFPGLNSIEDQSDSDTEGIIKYFNIYPLAKYDMQNGEEYLESGIDGYPVLGDLYQRENAGFFVVENTQEFYNAGDDPKGIQAGKYVINNVTMTPSTVFYDPITGNLRPNENMIKDLTLIGDLPTNEALNTSYPKFEIWQDYVIPDPIMSETFGFKIVYFKNGFPISAFTAQNPSGDFLFQQFYSEEPRYLPFNENHEYNSPIISAQFGISYTDAIIPEYYYDAKNKVLKICGIENNARYNVKIQSEISSISGITQSIQLNNKYPAVPIKLQWKRSVNDQFDIIKEYKISNLKNVNIWNYPKDSKEEFVRFQLQSKLYRKKLKQLKRITLSTWDYLDLQQLESDSGVRYFKLVSDNPLFYNLNEEFEINNEALTIFTEKKKCKCERKTYTLLINNYLYFVLYKDQIYDWGVISLPKFMLYRNPIFNVTIPGGDLVYGISVETNLRFTLKK